MLPISDAILRWSEEIGQNVMLIYYLRTINLSIAFRRLKHHMAHKNFQAIQDGCHVHYKEHLCRHHQVELHSNYGPAWWLVQKGVIDSLRL